MSESLAEVGVAPGEAIFLSGVKTEPPVTIVSVESQESNTNGTLFLSQSFQKKKKNNLIYVKTKKHL